MPISNPLRRLQLPEAEIYENPRKLQELASWYWEFAERAGNPAIWEARLLTARALEREADRLASVSARDRSSRPRERMGKTE